MPFEDSGMLLPSWKRFLRGSQRVGYPQVLLANSIQLPPLKHPSPLLAHQERRGQVVL